MKTIKILFILSAAVFMACQPATETRGHMDVASNRMSDSILKLIDSCLAQPGQILAGTGSPIASSASSFTPAIRPK